MHTQHIEVPVRRTAGKCAQVHRQLDRMVAKQGTPALREIAKIGLKRGWNPNNTRSEYYSWRKAHGISGRLHS